MIIYDLDMIIYDLFIIWLILKPAPFSENLARLHLSQNVFVFHINPMATRKHLERVRVMESHEVKVLNDELSLPSLLGYQKHDNERIHRSASSKDFRQPDLYKLFVLWGLLHQHKPRGHFTYVFDFPGRGRSISDHNNKPLVSSC